MTTLFGSSEPLETYFTTLILAHLIIHDLMQSTAKKKITKREIKTKEFSHLFAAMKSSYIQLLNAVLTKHCVSGKFQSMEHCHYGCKMQVPPIK